MTRFIVIGQERSGTTYVQMLLSSHPDIHCRGEMFDPWQIDDFGQKYTDQDAVRARDANPADFLGRMLSGEGLSAPLPAKLGIKVLTQHHPLLFSNVIPENPDLHLIHIRRENKLAQFASRRQVQKSGAWTSRAAPEPAPLIEPAPNWAVAECNRLENEDFLLAAWLDQLENPVLTLSYTSLFAPGTATRLCDFLQAEHHTDMTAGLHKQGQNRIADRFGNSAVISEHFKAIGKGHWLGPEL